MRPPLLDAIENLGYVVFESGLYNLNIIGIRNKGSQANTFDDRICVVCRDEKGWITRTWPCTTDPGTYWRENPMSIDGTAIVVPGQYRGIYRIGKHRGRYDALVQTAGPIKVYRDSNKDEILDMGNASDGYFGINIHKAGTDSSVVDRWSAGCQVFAKEADFDEFMRLCEEQPWDKFSYTLIEV